MVVLRAATFIAGLLATLIPLQAATLEKLSLDDMIVKSTSIVRAKVTGSRSAVRGSVIYTFSAVRVLERLKGDDVESIEVATPGGVHGGYRQEFSGAPQLRIGDEYVLFLWKGKSGIRHVIGLSQGLFFLDVDAHGVVRVHRAASNEVMLDPNTGRPVRDTTISMALSELRQRVGRTLGGVRR